MKARIKATGEVLNIIKVLGFEVLLSDGNIYDYNKVEYITEPDWQQVRIQAAIEIAGRATFTFDKLGNIPDDDFAVCAKRAVQMADALIAELQKKGGEQ